MKVHFLFFKKLESFKFFFSWKKIRLNISAIPTFQKTFFLISGKDSQQWKEVDININRIIIIIEGGLYKY